jgi:hypothetical protein
MPNAISPAPVSVSSDKFSLNKDEIHSQFLFVIRLLLSGILVSNLKYAGNLFIKGSISFWPSKDSDPMKSGMLVNKFATVASMRSLGWRIKARVGLVENILASASVSSIASRFTNV